MEDVVVEIGQTELEEQASLVPNRVAKAVIEARGKPVFVRAPPATANEVVIAMAQATHVPFQIKVGVARTKDIRVAAAQALLEQGDDEATKVYCAKALFNVEVEEAQAAVRHELEAVVLMAGGDPKHFLQAVPTPDHLSPFTANQVVPCIPKELMAHKWIARAAACHDKAAAPLAAFLARNNCDPTMAIPPMQSAAWQLATFYDAQHDKAKAKQALLSEPGALDEEWQAVKLSQLYEQLFYF